MSRSRRAPWLLHGAALLTGVAMVLGVFAAAAAAKPRQLFIGFDDSLFRSGDPQERAFAFERAEQISMSIMRVGVSWRHIAAERPPVARQADPGWPGYDWAGVDWAVLDAAARGIKVMFTVNGAPAWAEAPNRPANVDSGTWKPDTAAFGRFGKAIATRYNGSFPDPERPGQALPRVRFYEAWNEPNLDYFLAPQWRGKRLVGPARFRLLLNSFYNGVKAGQPGAKVLAPATAPYGDRPGSDRTPPVQFLRNLLCLRGGKLQPVRCPVKARFDILSHHPINSVAGPRRSARNPLDAATPDVGRLVRVLRKAERLNRVYPPRKRRPVWGTEMWWETDPPDPLLGTTLARQASYMNIAQLVLWQQGVQVGIFLPMIDAPGGAEPDGSLQSGIFFADGRPKPSFKVIRFPLVTQRLRRGRKLIWGKAPRRGRVKIQRREKGGWRTIARARGRPNVPFTVRLRVRRGAKVRGVVRGISSRPVKVR